MSNCALDYCLQVSNELLFQVNSVTFHNVFPQNYYKSLRLIFCINMCYVSGKMNINLKAQKVSLK